MSLIEKHLLECDILVAGGGPAGVPCAVAAARNGAKVILCQDRHVLGGNASSEVRMHIVGADGMRGGEDLVLETRESGIIEEIRLDTAVRNPQRSASMLDLILYEKCIQEPNLTLMLNTTVIGVKMEGTKIKEAYAVRESTEDHFTIRAKAFVDCTGDGRLGAEAGANYRQGREARDEFNESLSEADTADGKTLGNTLLFQASRHDKEVPFVTPSWARKFTPEQLKNRLYIKPDAVDCGLEYGYWWMEWGGELDIIKDNEKIRDELLAILMGVWGYIKNESGYEDAKYWALDWFSFLPGKRESRRFEGQYMLTQHDLMQSVDFPDAIAFGGWPVDTHPPGGVDDPEASPCRQTPVPHLFNIPLRACVSRNIDNLCFAGRNISASHIAFASTRVMATCATMGQGVGTALAYGVQHDIEPSLLSQNEAAIRKIQTLLRRDDCYLVRPEQPDEDDLIPSAEISASTEQANGLVANLLSGQTRAVEGERGAPAGRFVPGSNRWLGEERALPATIEFSWKTAQQIGRVDLVFDTGMHRKLTLSHSNGFHRHLVWGPQPETVKDYTIEALVGGEWKPIVQESGNYQRLRQHRLEKTVSADALRITVTATNGHDHARIFEVRAYA